MVKSGLRRWGRPPILKHEQLEELCVLAASGEIQEADWLLVQEHLEKCASCRETFADLGLVHSTVVPQAPNFIVERSPQAEGRMRNSILRAATREGVRFSACVQPYTESDIRANEVDSAHRMRTVIIALGTLLAAACGVAAFSLRQPGRLGAPATSPTAVAPTPIPDFPPVPYRAAPKYVPSLSSSSVASARASNSATASHPSQAQGASSASVTSSASSTSASVTLDAARLHQEVLEQEVAALRAERIRLEAALQQAQSENKNLQGSAADMKQQVAQLSVELQSTRSTQAKAEAQLQQMKAERASDQTALEVQNREIVSLNEKLLQQSSQKERDQDIVAAETKLRELVGARNLHIVDVYDTDPNGKTSKAVGRVFYKQGQSLVFYAYDLSNNKSESGKYAYYVWGHRGNSTETVSNLGTLDPDDPAQNRWMLKSNDAQALANIDRLFVTLEQTAKIGAHPRGKKILSAYLGNPVNHP